MKMILVLYNVAIHEELMEKLQSLALTGYTRWERVVGQGKSSGPHLGTHIWPAFNSSLAIAAENEQAGAIVQAVRELKKQMPHQGIKAIVWPVELII